MKAKSFLDRMPAEKRKMYEERAEKRLQASKAKRGLSVSPEFYMAAEFGYYFGWDAVVALRRGYTVEPVSGDKELLTMAEAQLLLEGARKVWYSKLVDHAETSVIANTFNASSKSFDQAIKPIKDKASIEE